MSAIVRVLRLLVGLALYGLSIALLLRSELGLDPWDVFHQGVARRTGAPIGVVVIVASVVVLLLWIPLRQRPGIGTVANALLVGVFVEVALALLPTTERVALQIGLLVTGVLLNAIATGLYISAALGPGARDGLMTGLAARGIPIRRARTAVEVVVLAIGWLLGGTVGIGTVVYAVSIGPLAHIFIPLFASGPPAGEIGP